MKFRTVEVQCGECSSGKCYVVECKGMFGWKPFITTYDYGGRELAEHFGSPTDARLGFHRMVAGFTKVVSSSVVDQWEYKGSRVNVAENFGI